MSSVLFSLSSFIVCAQTSASKSLSVFANVKESFPSVPHLLRSRIFDYRCSCRVSLNAHFHRDYIQLCLDNNLTAKSRIVARRNTVLLCEAREPQTGTRQCRWWLRELRIQMRERRWSDTDVLLFEDSSSARSPRVRGHTSPHTKLYTRAPTAAPLNHPSRGPIHLLLVDWDPITIPNRARMKEWQTACEETDSQGRLMGQILGWFMRHPTSLHTYHQESLMPYGTKKHAFHHTPCIIQPFVALHFEKSQFSQGYIFLSSTSFVSWCHIRLVFM